MVVALSQFILAFLVAVGLLFIAVELRAAFERTFLYFGVSLLVFAFVTGIDVWFLADDSTMSEVLYWNRIQHAAFCVYVPFTMLYTMYFTHSLKPFLIKTAAGVSTLLALLFMSPALIKVADGHLTMSFAYWPLFGLYVVISATIVLHGIFNRLRTSRSAERRVLWFHLLGFAALACTGVLDMLAISGFDLLRLPPSFPSFFMFGVLVFGISTSLVFAERLLMLIKDRQAAYAKLRSAYHEMESAASLRQLGESAAIASHEIRNYLTGVRGSADLMLTRGDLTSRDRLMTQNIVKSTDKLLKFTRQVLDLSKERIVDEKEPINLAGLVRASIHEHFRARAECFAWEGDWDSAVMHGDWDKLGHVFVNVFKNAFEAGATTISVRAWCRRDLLLVSMEDNGSGIDDPYVLKHLFTAFHTSKKGSEGTGLGMSFSRAIVESHGGRISAYSRNLMPEGGHGVRIVAAFPVYTEEIAATSQPSRRIVLVQDGMDYLEDVVTVLRNVNVTPKLTVGAHELSGELEGGGIIVLVDAGHVADIGSLQLADTEIVAMSADLEQTYALRPNHDCTPRLFCEEFVLSDLLSA